MSYNIQHCLSPVPHPRVESIPYCWPNLNPYLTPFTTDLSWLPRKRERTNLQKNSWSSILGDDFEHTINIPGWKKIREDDIRAK